MTDTVTERDEAIAERLVAGDSVRAVGRQFGCSIAEVHLVLEHTLEISNEVRRHMVMVDAAQLSRLLQTFYTKAIEEKCTQSALVAVRIWERKHELLGLNSAQKIDIVQVRAEQQPSSFDRIREAIERVARPERFAIDANGNGNGKAEPSGS